MLTTPIYLLHSRTLPSSSSQRLPLSWPKVFRRALRTRRRLYMLRINFNADTTLLKYILMLCSDIITPHQCIAHHGAEHRAAAAAEKTTASASPSRLWIQSYPG